eukprot:gnl/TRDRNA2_/TRDRNA2_202384_c0_seq1.p1 gnl/TRDRNA2_/TRDRNA2_202384_c0~~gnl/TRDRNA2_/TRDRNA2_202384_c0_seq1.p1  ORF type:complete len:546 (+),score=53.38 gnl/TRDRNA2_/TRDRNA2_202384_c0_seq1:62-1699(+)
MPRGLTHEQIVQQSELVAWNEECARRFAHDSCAICHESYNIVTPDICRVLDCSHVYHAKCIDLWFIKATFCPLCKSDLKCGFKPTSSQRSLGRSSHSSSQRSLGSQRSMSIRSGQILVGHSNSDPALLRILQENPMAVFHRQRLGEPNAGSPPMTPDRHQGSAASLTISYSDRSLPAMGSSRSEMSIGMLSSSSSHVLDIVREVSDETSLTSELPSPPRIAIPASPPIAIPAILGGGTYGGSGSGRAATARAPVIPSRPPRLGRHHLEQQGQQSQRDRCSSEEEQERQERRRQREEQQQPPPSPSSVTATTTPSTASQETTAGSSSSSSHLGELTAATAWHAAEPNSGEEASGDERQTSFAEGSGRQGEAGTSPAKALRVIPPSHQPPRPQASNTLHARRTHRSSSMPASAHAKSTLASTPPGSGRSTSISPVSCSSRHNTETATVVAKTVQFRSGISTPPSSASATPPPGPAIASASPSSSIPAMHLPNYSTPPYRDSVAMSNGGTFWGSFQGSPVVSRAYPAPQQQQQRASSPVVLRAFAADL